MVSRRPRSRNQTEQPTAVDRLISPSFGANARMALLLEAVDRYVAIQSGHDDLESDCFRYEREDAAPTKRLLL